jgi:hypothetical protein
MGTHETARSHVVQVVLDELAAWQADGDGYLSRLDDTAFVAAWAAVRHGLIAKHGPEAVLRRLYAAMHAEFLRRACRWGRLDPRTGQARP